MTCTDPSHYDPSPLVRGAPWVFTVRWLADGVPMDLSGATVTFTAIWAATKEYGAGDLSKTFTGFDSSGEITIELTADETAELPPSGVSEAGAFTRYQIAVNDEILMDGNLNVRRNLFLEAAD